VPGRPLARVYKGWPSLREDRKAEQLKGRLHQAVRRARRVSEEELEEVTAVVLATVIGRRPQLRRGRSGPGPWPCRSGPTSGPVPWSPLRPAARLKERVPPNSRSTRSGAWPGRCSPWSGPGRPARPAQSSLSVLASGPPLGPADNEHWGTGDLGRRVARRRRLRGGGESNALNNTAPVDPVPDLFDRQSPLVEAFPAILALTTRETAGVRAA
jgi:hypothetical protein